MTSVKAEPVLTAVCDERQWTKRDGEEYLKGGSLIERSVYPLILTPETLKTFWEKARKFQYLFDRSINNDFKTFCELLLTDGPEGVQPTGLFWVVDNFVGIFYLSKIIPGVDASVHYTFFDRRHHGRLELTKEMLKYGFRKYNFRRMTVELPLYAREYTFKFVEELGFKREGRKRKAVWHNDDWFDIVLFGILKEEALKE